MLFAENDAPFLRAWIIKRLANTSDADADVLADYVLALLRHDDVDTNIRKLFEDEIPDFLREDSAAFIDDVFQAIKFRSYLPGAPPPPPIIRNKPSQPIQPAPALIPPALIPSTDEYQPQFPAYTPSQPLAGALAGAPLGPSSSRKRAYDDGDDNDVEFILNSRPSHHGAPPYKHQRRGGSFAQRGAGRFDDPNIPRGPRGGPGLYQPQQLPTPTASGFYRAPSAYQPTPPHAQHVPQIDPNSILDNIQRLHELGVPLPQTELINPVYSGTPFTPPRRKKQRCRDYDAKGYCSRGNTCMYEHGTGAMYVPGVTSQSEEYDPNNAVLPQFQFNHRNTSQHAPIDMSTFQVKPSSNHRDQGKQPKRQKSRPAFAFAGPMHDKSKTTLVVQQIPAEYFEEQKIRDYFSQFGNIINVSIQEKNQVALVKFDSWEAANAAWSSPKVIFDNRFVKVFWLKDDTKLGPSASGNHDGAKNGFANGNSQEISGKSVSADPEFDMEDFLKKQEEAQKIHQEKVKKRQEIDRQREELEQRQKELLAKQVEEKRKLEAKLAAAGRKDSSSSPTEIQIKSDDKTSGEGRTPSAKTEALRAQLAALEAEANTLGLDPNAAQEEYSPWATRGRGRGFGYRGRGGFAPRGRGSRGGYGYQGRGGTGVEARHAAYAAYSLDLRPKTVALTGVDFSIPEKNEALRQYLFSIGEFNEVHADTASTTVSFKDRKTAEKFVAGVKKGESSNTIPGVDENFEVSWSTDPPRPSAASNANADGDALMASGLEDEHAMAAGRDKSAPLEEGEIGGLDQAPGGDTGDMDYEGW
ncbi:hypothetical protein F4778DRAFT_717245 [Xylariomycetidae sp. FL2044]|nr:hypothetical protein F4778DRAFT_717245 [Xylariomycetidae sp. FL2044]